jgi:hypothetical protein
LLPARLRIHLPPERRARFHELARERDATYAPIYDTGVVASVIRRALHLETKS